MKLVGSTARVCVLADDDLPLDSNVETKFHVFSGIGYVVLALIFTAPNRNSPTRFSLSLIFRKKHLERYLVLHQVVQEHMLRLVNKLKTVLLWVTLAYLTHSHTTHTHHTRTHTRC